MCCVCRLDYCCDLNMSKDAHVRIPPVTLQHCRLQAAHAQGIVHRALNVQTILVDFVNNSIILKLTNFSKSACIRLHAESLSPANDPAYVCPEIAAHPLKPGTDVSR